MWNRTAWFVVFSIAIVGPTARLVCGQSPIRWSVMEMGAVADGTTDNTKSFQKALDAARQAGGGIVEVPAGRYRIAGTLSIPQGVTFQGTYRVPPTRNSMTEKPHGTVLLAYAGRGSAEGPPFICLAGNNSAVAGLVIEYPEWKKIRRAARTLSAVRCVAEHRQCRHPRMLFP